MLMARSQDFESWMGTVSKQLEILYKVEADIFSDVYDFKKAYEDNRSSRLVVEDLALYL